MLGLDHESTAPWLSIGDYAFADFNYSLVDHAANDDQLGLLGNDILKRFNVILDNQNGFIYLQPNSLAQAAFSNPEYYLARGIAGVAASIAAGCAWFVYRRHRNRKVK